jgi:beta-glucosidase
LAFKKRRFAGLVRSEFPSSGSFYPTSMKANHFGWLHAGRTAVFFCAVLIAALAPWQARAVCVTAITGGIWQDAAITAQTGTFTATFDATPSASPTNSVIALSNGAQTIYGNFACLARFNPTGDIDARNGGAFAGPTTPIPYSAGVSYHFRLVVNVPTQTYSIYVTPAGGSELTVGTNFAFRIADTTLDYWGVFVTPGTGGASSVTVCNFSTSTPPPPSTIAIRALANNKYVTAANATTSLIANSSTSSGRAQQFDVVNLGRGIIALRAHSDNLYVTAENAGARPLIANRTAARLWETFQKITVSGGVALKAAVNGKYVTAPNAGASPLIANRTVVGPSETFVFEIPGSPQLPTTPSFSPFGGTYTSTQSVAITSAGATAIYYTTNGSPPTTASTHYTVPVTIANTTALQAIGVNSAGISPVGTAVYTIVESDFSLSATSTSPTVLLGESTACTITAIPSNGFAGTINLNVSGLPVGVTAAFSPASINGPGNSSLTLSASVSAPTGTYLLTITGTCNSPSLAHSLVVPLSVSTNSSVQQAIAVVGQMSLAEEISQVHGAQDAFSFRYIPASAHAPIYYFTNGPAGIGNSGNGHGGSATAMPAPIALAATFDVNLAYLYGSIIGKEAVDYSNDMIEAPDMNIARVPQNGRTFEAFGEDPYLVGQIAVNNIEGIQDQGISAESKHFAGNNQETNRLSINAIIDERTLREIYLPAFEATVLQGHVDAVMGAYNKVNGTFCCENMTLLHDILKGEWGFTGYTTSDFGATHSTIPSALAGLDAEMPTAIFYGSALQSAVTANLVPKAVLDEMLIRRISTMINRGVFHAPLTNTPIPVAADGATARQIAEAGMVLLKNNGNTLPLQIPQLQSIALIGPFATSAMTGGGGSSHVPPVYTVTPLAGIQSRVAGSGITVQLNDGSNIASAATLAQNSTVAIVMVGDSETEGVDDSISLSGNQYPNQDALVQAVAAANPHTVVVLKTGTAVLMPWVNQVPAILEAWYPGEEDGNAVAAVLFGDVNPSGKLPLTFPVNVSDCPANTPAQYPGINDTETYSEGIFVGYRHFDASNITPLFPFGHGLSYTTFQYQNLAINPATTTFVGNPGNTVSVDFDITNTGLVAGSEAAQVYVGKPALPNGLQDPPQWLKGFQKVTMTPGQTGHVHVVLNLRSFAFWDVTTHAWVVAPGTYSIYVGSSSRDIRLLGQVTIN